MVISSGSLKQCPHCLVVVKFIAPDSGPVVLAIQSETDYFDLFSVKCPNCNKLVISMRMKIPIPGGGLAFTGNEYILWPYMVGRKPAPPEVPENIGANYNEASSILSLSPKASAALSRRCLQTILRDAGKTKSKELSKQIDEIIDSLPTYISKNVDAIRNIGNFAAHEQKSTNSGEILDVEPGEAEWNLEVLDTLFDFYYVRPKIEEQKRIELDRKLSEAGKPPLKQP